ncbi:helicase HerA-like domain-containing protein [Rhizobium yanglingense]
MPEVGGYPDKPKLVFFFDEAHLLFDDAPRVLTERVEQVVRLIRSQGRRRRILSTQNPLDVPETVLAQLGNRVQHALRAYSPREQKAVRTAADTLRPNPAFDCATVITNLAHRREALVSTLETKGAPSIVERTLIRPPSGRVGPVTEAERRQIMDRSPVSSDLWRGCRPRLCLRNAQQPARRRLPKAEAAKRAQEEAEAQQTSAGTTSGWTLPGFGGSDDEQPTAANRAGVRPAISGDGRRGGDEKRGRGRLRRRSAGRRRAAFGEFEAVGRGGKLKGEVIRSPYPLCPAGQMGCQGV